jgi:integrase
MHATRIYASASSPSAGVSRLGLLRHAAPPAATTGARPYELEWAGRTQDHTPPLGLLACTGLRLGEALRLRPQDIDAPHGAGAWPCGGADGMRT